MQISNVGRCTQCNKIKFSTNHDAKRFLKKHRYRGLHPYWCKHTGDWHLGHIPHDVRFGAAARDNYVELADGARHIHLHVNRMVGGLVRNELTYQPTFNTVANRVISHIAFIQRTEERNPSLKEAAKFPDEYWDRTQHPDEDWAGTNAEWLVDVRIATMLELARRLIIRVDEHGSECRIHPAHIDLLRAAV